MITQKKIANAVGGKTARACESCLKRRAKWFCAADDAFLCHACDSSVHSANELAGRHNRVRLEAKTNTQPPPPIALPCTSWHHGFTKKARTPRGNSKASKLSHRINNYEMRVVPEVSNDLDEGSVGGDDEDRNEAVFSVPNLDVHQHLFESKGFEGEHIASAGMDDFNISLIGFDGDNEWENYLPDGFLPSDIELAEFAADVESLLEHPEAGGDGVKADKEAGEEQLYFPGVKIEEGEISTTTTTTTTNDHCYFDWSIDVETEMFNFDLNTDYMGNDQSQVSGAEEEEENGCRQVVMPKNEGAEVEVKEEVGLGNDMEANNSNKRRKILLRLNYDEVINAWTSQGCVSPWTTGHRPEFDLDHHGWPYCMGGTFPYGVHRQGEEWMGVRGGDEVREARVSRYREKRRTRLFSKKIRYEVRKLNAEKRPRLKGRFVKRTSLSSVVAVGVDC